MEIYKEKESYKEKGKIYRERESVRERKDENLNFTESLEKS